MTVEDFTTYFENDGDIEKTENTVTFTTMRRDADAYVYKDFGAGHFGDFEHLFTFRLTAGEAGDISDRNWGDIHTLSDGIGSVADNDNDTFGVSLIQNQGINDKVYFLLKQKENTVLVDSDKSALYDAGSSLYMTIKRAGTVGTLKIYSDSARTNLLETLTITCNTTTYRYLHVIRSGKWVEDPADHISGFVRNLDLQTAPPDPPTNVSATDGTYSDKVRITWTKSPGATGYQVYRDGVGLGWLGDVDLKDDSGADAPYITPGSALASDGTFTTKVHLDLSGTHTNDGTVHIYKVKARNAAGESGYSGTNTGYRGPGPLGYQWYKSAGDYDSGYGSISGATTCPYDYTGAPAPTITPGTAAASDGEYTAHVRLTLSGESANPGAGRYYKCYLSAAGCYLVWSGSNRGYRGVGPLTYQWQRSAADSDASYGNITGATYEPYNDTGAPENGDGRYYRCYLTATSASSQYSTSDRGYRAVAVTTMIGGPAAWDWGAAVASVSVVRITSDGGRTWIWGLAIGTITIPVGGPLGWEWEEVAF